MRYFALATDFDGTLAHDGVVDQDTLSSLHLLRSSGRHLVLVTGRELEELQNTFPHLDLFERVVVENGALLYNPATREEKVLGEAPPAQFVEELRRRGVTPLSVGRSIVATWDSQETAVLEAIKALGIERQVIFNKGSVMALPSGINKATGLKVALDELRLSPRNTVGIGDAENDHAFLAFCEFSVAVANALPALKERADLVTNGDRGAGVTELIEQLVNDDLKGIATRVTRRNVVLGERMDGGGDATVSPYCPGILLAGRSGSGKSTVSAAFLERLCEGGYQYCVIDPEGDYGELDNVVVMGDAQRQPGVDTILKALESPSQSVAVNLLAVPLEERPQFFDRLLPRIQELRVKTGRPHWIIVDEAHHLLPSGWDPANLTIPQELKSTVFITIHPEHMSPAALVNVDTVFAVGREPERTIRSFAEGLGIRPPATGTVELEQGEVLAWSRPAGEPYRFRVTPPHGERMRHRRKYAEGELPPDRSFFFRGPDGRLKLRAQNLNVFLQLAEGVDDETWIYHLRRGDYANWFGAKIKDPDLAEAASRIEENLRNQPAAESRKKIREAIEKRYTVPG